MDEMVASARRDVPVAPPVAHRPWFTRPAPLRAVVIVALVLLLEAVARLGLVSPIVMPPPSEIAMGVAEAVGSAELWSDLGRTGVTVLLAFTIGAFSGLALGLLGWRFPVLYTVLEPYLVSMYAMPMLVFYPLLVIVTGLGVWPMTLIASFMAMVPVAINVVVALTAVSPVLLKVGRSFRAGRLRFARSVLAPAALPLAMPGLRLGFIYSIIGVVAMEFVLADRGLGFRIGVSYRTYEIVHMWALIVILAIVAVALNRLGAAVERRVRADITD